ncbi:MAG: nodulation protein NfeD [Campylobacterota bacterium]|nr:nodulation protein NfeD [Campylobacterota bacterium]
MRRLLFLLFLIFLPFLTASAAVVKLEMKGAIGPASSGYLKEAISVAIDRNAQMVLIELDTPGGLSTSMRDMVQDIVNSTIPIVVFVSPKGARAASAGTYILYASHVACMAPGTNLGAATPVSLITLPNSKDLNTTIPSTLEKKAINDSMAYIKSLAQLNDRNISWALDAVKEAKSLSAQDALKLEVIDIIANDTKELLSKLDGRTVKVLGKAITLQTKQIEIINYEANWKTRFLSIITNPNIAYIFLLIAIYGVFFELMNPGSIFPGVVGVISGIIALYALNMIPFNYAGLALIILGISLIIAEVFIAGFGILGIGGVISFAFGSLLLFDADTLGSSVSIPLIIAFTLSSLLFFIFVMKLFINSRSKKVVTGIEQMVGSMGEVSKVDENSYHVYCHGEIWSAKSESKLEVGQRVEVVKLTDLTLEVKPIKG